MASVFPGTRISPRVSPPVSASALARAMSWHASGALMLFALLQIAGLVLIDGAAGGVLPFVALGLLLLGAMPLARGIDRRWSRLADMALPSTGLYRRFRRDRARLWQAALLVPPLWFGIAVLVTDGVIARAAAF